MKEYTQSELLRKIVMLQMENEKLKDRLEARPHKLGRRPFTLSKEQVRHLNWAEPNRILAEKLGVSFMTVIKLRKQNHIPALPRGRMFETNHNNGHHNGQH